MTMRAGNAARLFAFAFALCAQQPQAARAQSAGVLARAGALRDVGEFASAARLLEEELQRSPSDVAVLRTLAQIHHWMHRSSDAVARYDAALALAPDDVGLRLEFARTLIELRNGRRAREVLQPLLDAGNRDAVFLLGLDAYWRGDFTTARRQFERALANAPNHAGADSLLGEIRAASAPWLRIEPSGQHDSQQLDRTGFLAEGGVFLTPLHVLAIETAIRQFSWGDSSATVSVAQLTTRRSFARAGIAAAMSMGAAHWSTRDTTSLVVRASVALRLAQRVELTASAERTPYVATTSSISAPLALDRAELRLAAERLRLHAEAVARIERFPDDNRVYTAYAWALTPLLRGRTGELKVGYAVAVQDAGEDRVIPVLLGTTPEGMPEFGARYAPYHTPQRLIANSVAAAAGVRLSDASGLSLNGSWAFYAREDAAVFIADTVSGAPLRTTYRRAFHPLELRASFHAAMTRRTSVFVEASHVRTAFYDATRAGAGLVLRFLPRSP